MYTIIKTKETTDQLTTLQSNYRIALSKRDEMEILIANAQLKSYQSKS